MLKPSIIHVDFPVDSFNICCFAGEQTQSDDEGGVMFVNSS